MNFTPIRISTIKPHEKINFDVYIYFRDRYLKYIDNGRELEKDHLDKLKKQKIARFYITDEDEGRYQEFLDRLFNNFLSDPNASTEEKVTFVEGSSTQAFDKMQKDPSSAQSYSMTQKAARGLRQIVSSNPDALKEFYGRKAGAGDIIIKHCLNVCALSTRLAEAHECKEDELDDLATAALLHDIGLTQLTETEQLMFQKGLKDLLQPEVLIYRGHPTAAIKLLERNPLINKRILDLIVNHEEKISGQGYPHKLTKLSLLEEILSLVNCYDKKVTILGMKSTDALKDLRVNELGNYSLVLINKFKEILKKDKLSE